MTFRMRGHEEASGVKYVPKELFEEWAKNDPVVNFESYLKSEQILDVEKIAEIRAAIQVEIDDGHGCTGFAAQPVPGKRLIP